MQGRVAGFAVEAVVGLALADGRFRAATTAGERPGRRREETDGVRTDEEGLEPVEAGDPGHRSVSGEFDAVVSRAERLSGERCPREPGWPVPPIPVKPEGPGSGRGDVVATW
jgi:hypothetical protein